jgi:hypothetical protein
VLGDPAAAVVAAARLDHVRAQACVEAELGRRREALDVADLSGDAERIDPTEARRGAQQRDVVIGAWRGQGFNSREKGTDNPPQLVISRVTTMRGVSRTPQRTLISPVEDLTMRLATVTELPLRLHPVEPDTFLDPPRSDRVPPGVVRGRSRPPTVPRRLRAARLAPESTEAGLQGRNAELAA